MVVLCYLEGQTCEAAARQLGWPVGTVKSRMARGKNARCGRAAPPRPGAEDDLTIVQTAALTLVMPAALAKHTVQAMLRLGSSGSTAVPATAHFLGIRPPFLDRQSPAHAIIAAVVLLQPDALGCSILGLAATGVAMLATRAPEPGQRVVPVNANAARESPSSLALATP